MHSNISIPEQCNGLVDIKVYLEDALPSPVKPEIYAFDVSGVSLPEPEPPKKEKVKPPFR